MAHRYGLTKTQIKKNRRSIKQMWEQIPEEWVNLNEILVVPDQSSRYSLLPTDLLAVQLSDADNSCGAVGCFLGWNYTNREYQDWCRKYDMIINSSENMNRWLGLSKGHGFYMPRSRCMIPQKQEVLERIGVMMHMPIMFEDSKVEAL